MQEKGKYTKEQIIDGADELFEELENKKKQSLLNIMDGKLDFDEHQNYENMIVAAFEDSSEDEVGKYVGQINKTLEDYPSLVDISKLKLEVLIEENYGDEKRLDVLNEFNNLLFSVSKKDEIFQIGSMSKEDIAELSSNTEVTGVVVAKKNIDILIKTFEVGKAVKTMNELEKIFEKYSQLKPDMKMMIDQTVEEIEKILGGKNDPILLGKIDALKAISDHFSKGRSK